MATINNNEKMTWSWKNYTEPTPKNLKAWGAGIVGFGGTITGSSLVSQLTSDSKNDTLLWLGLISLIITGIGHFAIEFVKGYE